MHMLYNSDSFVVVRFEVPAGDAPDLQRAPARGGFEIVDKFAGKGIYLEGALAERFHEGVQALARHDPTPEQIDDYISGYTQLAQQTVTLH
jgi:23S rRNA A2030 N6-methylase RlmJ